MSRRSRYTAALVATAALLFAPLAVSVHACPMDGLAMQGGSHGSDVPPEASLCMRHCEDGQASLDTVKPAPAFQLAILPALRVAPAAPPETAHSAWRKDGFLADPSPPLTRFTVLRI
jgi:hypothetical protein